MKKQKLPQFELSTEGEITSVTFNTIEFKELYNEEVKKVYKKLTENTRIVKYLVDKDGYYTLLNQDNFKNLDL
jgi:hypothetical protein